MNKQDKHTASINHNARMAAIFCTAAGEMLDDFSDTVANHFTQEEIIKLSHIIGKASINDKDGELEKFVQQETFKYFRKLLETAIK